MCKFTNHLFAFAILFVLNVSAAPFPLPEHRSEDGVDDALELFDLRTIFKLIEAYNDYDLHYDQRQNGKANLRKRLDGFLIIAPTDLFGEQELPDPGNFGLLDDFLSDDGRNMQKPSVNQLPTERPIELLKNPQTTEEPTSKKSLESVLDASNGRRRLNLNHVFNVLKTLIKQ